MITTIIATAILTAPQSMPAFNLKGIDGLTYTQASLTKRPTIVVFWNKGCPHNPTSAPIFNRLQKELASKVSVVGFINAPAAEAKTYAKTIKLTIPLIADPTGKTIEKMGATHSLDIALISPKSKKIEEYSNGYKQSIVSTFLTKARSWGTVPNLKLDYIPSKMQSGCGF